MVPAITKIDIYKLSIPLAIPYGTSLGLFDHADNIIIKIHSSEGLYGVGEGCPGTSVTGDSQAMDFESAQLLGTLIMGKNPLAVEARMKEIDSFLVHNSTIRSAFDIALYDLLAKKAGLPLYALLGGEQRILQTDMTVGLASPEKMAQQALKYVEQGFLSIKVKLGTNFDDDVARIRAIRETIGEKTLIRIDANQGWDQVTAIRILQALVPFSIQFCEEPVAHWNNRALKYVHEHSPIAIMSDESLFDHHDAYRLASMEVCDYFNIKLAKSGGIHTALKINAVAESAGIKCMIGSMDETNLAMSAAAHLVSAFPNIEFADLDAALFLAEDPVIGGVTYEGGKITLTDTPGHGADFDSEYLKTLESISITQKGDF